MKKNNPNLLCFRHWGGGSLGNKSAAKVSFFNFLTLNRDEF